MRTGPRASSSAPSRITTRPLGSTASTPRPLTTAATPTEPRARSTAPSGITTRRSGSTPKTLERISIADLQTYIRARLPKALADLNQASALDPKYAHTALWREIVDRRSNLPSRLSEAITQIDMTKWPAPIIRLYLGQIAPEAVLNAAHDSNANKKKEQLCEANFYLGELALQRGTKDEAVRLFGLAAAECRKNVNLWADAQAELRALGAQP